MSDQLATEKVECPCCKGAKVLAVYDTDGYTQIGNVACCYCVATGYILTEPHPLGGRRPVPLPATENDQAFARGYATAMREFSVNRHLLPKGKEAAARKRSRKAKGVPRKKKKGR